MFAAASLMVLAVVAAAARPSDHAWVAVLYPVEIVEATSWPCWMSAFAAPVADVLPTLFAIVCQSPQKSLSWDARPLLLGSFSDVSTELTAVDVVLQ